MSKRPDLTAMSEAVQAWYQFYEVPRNDHSSRVLCSAAVELYNDGIRNVDDIAAALIGTYIGVWSTKINAPTSASVH
ncbi:hypothetical protein ACCS68_29115 [Rhizobium beringeri]|uniref:hypothetical protein n=1 Tax=Rhizobium TaxID=379 RepID=UPI001032162B|nr:hypothetical protein [Rhizobium leguminosarum]TAU52512.1 hypothetical protein ELI43_06615 [Rhizobium leguminosarum]TAW53263.1 hypothetical protein ELI14_19150 [Rhizobium leguminosarum]